MKTLLSFLIATFVSIFATAQSSTYVSSVDEELSLTSWALSPIIDNLDGIYARPLNDELLRMMENESQLKLRELQGKGPTLAPEDFEEKPALAKQTLVKNSIDAFLSGRVTKGPRGLTLRLVLFTRSAGLPLVNYQSADIKSFDLVDLRREAQSAYRSLMSQLPYRAVILSRRGTQVTMNIGRDALVKEGQEVLAVQIYKAQRHPRFQFLTSVEKEIMGKIRIDKIEEHLSFGSIVSERTEGLIRPGFKLHYEDFVNYSPTAKTQDQALHPGLTDRADSEVAFGKDPKEWNPLNPPSFGKVGLLLGFGNYSLSNNLATSGSVESRNTLVPSFHVESEMWLSANWFLGVELHQYVTKLENDLSGSSPGSLELQTLETELVGGYNVLVSEEFWGPKLQLMFGMSQMDSKIEDSTPTAFTSVKYGGLAFGVAGSIPLGQETSLPLTLGGKFMYYWNPTLSEVPTSSGDRSTNRISTFSISGEYQKTSRLGFRGELSFRQYNSNLAGSGTRAESASSIGHSMTTLAGGLLFMF